MCLELREFIRHSVLHSNYVATGLFPAPLLADATAEAMYSRDRAAQALGLKIVRVQPGKSLLTMTVRGDMTRRLQALHRSYAWQHGEPLPFMS